MQCQILLTIFIWTSITEHILSSPHTTVAQGKLVGTWMTTRGRRQIAAFRGIPYAAPPIHELRFQSPKPAPPWQGTKRAIEDGAKCIQIGSILGFHGKEDCLYLNVFTPSVTGSHKLPVMVFIHGGGFKGGSGSSSTYGPEYLLDEDVVLVTFNYRLGVFGFLSLEDEVLPGNVGLKDQREALRWVRDNIAQFDGDPTAVTLFGESAGAASVHYHMLYNTDEDLFRAGILQSGSVQTTGVFQRPGEQKPLVSHILDQTDCQYETSTAIVECLRKVRPFKLARSVQSFFKPYESLMGIVEFSPVIEPDCIEDAFITDDPWKRTSSLPMLAGTNKYEGLFLLIDLLKDKSNETFKYFDTNFEEIIPSSLMLKTSAEDPSHVAKLLQKFYLKDDAIDREHVLQLSDLISDAVFNYGLSKAIKNNQNTKYLYSFNYQGAKSIMESLGLENIYGGPIHSDELFYFFPFYSRYIHKNSNKIEDDKMLSKQLVKMWTNFATHQVPLSDGYWVPISTSDLEFLSINGPNNYSMETKFYKARMDFWEELPFRNKPYPDSISCKK